MPLTLHIHALVAALADGRVEEVIEECTAAELANPFSPLGDVALVLMAAHVVKGDLTGARYVVKRCVANDGDDDARTGAGAGENQVPVDPRLKALADVSAALHSESFADAHAALAGLTWDGDVEALPAVVIQALRSAAKSAMVAAFEVVAVARAAAMLGLDNDAAMTELVASGWTLSDNGAFLTPPEATKDSTLAPSQSKQIAQLTQAVLDLETL
ncbi:uncharacterized protein AMSG_07809 [Thecamonas trahens ATCC 50062]|uniref:CSN8/PSMD8/EIF3K domain-containing protein n=1 Tax=Thecamonas trahens ATCC 50062 TaxID=461836 RepID=A0A0L0DHP2_THETB|nr:hypothetical protein AMSG_07809 [Thecamonas trahens ATCC 50062]KNC51740.1 hypothetical protein AMSG_07809 [Thecamonas trahens ATCC 50062]|eukprot:XP_013755868.1 hypothetical protein AMSG_07809 [Thecamonas trahens ATCC 50062]